MLIKEQFEYTENFKVENYISYSSNINVYFVVYFHVVIFLYRDISTDSYFM